MARTQVPPTPRPPLVGKHTPPKRWVQKRKPERWVKKR